MGFPTFASISSRRQSLFAVLSLVLVELIVYGPFTRSLGFYWDDWPVVSIYTLFGKSGLKPYFTGNRPAVGWLFSHLFPLLGIGPLGWHLAIMMVAALTGITIYWTFSTLWPTRRDVAWLAAALTLVYPGFTQQSIAITYLPHYISLLLFVLSLRISILAVDSLRARGVVLWTATAILLGLASYVLTEYFIGLELLRWLVLAYRLRQSGQTKPFLAPYVLVWAVFMVWRTVFYRSADNAGYKDAGSALQQIAHHPIHGLIDRIGAFLHNLTVAGLLAWLRPFDTNLIDGGVKHLIAIWVVGAAVFVLSAMVLRSFGERETKEANFRLRVEAAIGGLLVSGLPLLVSGFRGDFGPFPSYEDRFLLPFTLTSSLLLALLLIRSTPVWLISGLLCVLTVFQVSNNIAYHRDWRRQRSIFWQAEWRAPSLRPGTSIFADGLPKSLFKNHSAGIFDVMYGMKPTSDSLSYFIFDLAQMKAAAKPPSFKPSAISEGEVRSYRFQGRTSDSVVWWISQDGILHTIDSSDPDGPHYSGLSDNLARLSAPSRVILDGPEDRHRLFDMFGAEPYHDSLYYYQRADLERQEHKWEGIVELGEEAIRNHEQPTEGAEWVPFIEGYARMGRYEQAEQFTERALVESPELQQPLSSLWQKLLALQPAAPPIRVMLALNERLDLGIPDELSAMLSPQQQLMKGDFSW
jgi:hypothetical protein